jgi:uncharacterized membrane protein YkvA (DUF1232 family)
MKSVTQIPPSLEVLMEANVDLWPVQLTATKDVSMALAYALSPIDLIPDFIPVIGLIDDLIILPALLWLAIKCIPEDALAEARRRAEQEPLRLSQTWGVAVVFLLIWVRYALYKHAEVRVSFPTFVEVNEIQLFLNILKNNYQQLTGPSVPVHPLQYSLF